MDSNLYGVFPVKWLFSAYGLFFVRSGKGSSSGRARDHVPERAEWVKGPKRLAKLGGLPLSVACISQRLGIFRSEGANQDDLPRASGVAEDDPVSGDRVSL